MQQLSPTLGIRAPQPPAITLRLASDARLVRLVAAGSEGAMAAIFERHHRTLHRYCYSILGNSHDASDALQNTMVRALGALVGETRPIALRPWLYRIAHNEAVTLLRARRPECDLDAAIYLSDAASAGAVETRERLRSLTEDLIELTERQRAALLMRELGGLAFSEVAEALGSSPAAVKQSVYEARCALQAMEEGRSMECDAVRRTLSDGDRRVARAMRMRGHLRGCAGCREFQAALHHRPAQLTATIPPLPVAAAASILQGVIGGGGGGGGLVAGAVATAHVTAGASLAANAIAVVAVSATIVGGAVYAVPRLAAAAHGSPAGVTASVGADSLVAAAAARGANRGGPGWPTNIALGGARERATTPGPTNLGDSADGHAQASVPEPREVATADVGDASPAVSDEAASRPVDNPVDESTSKPVDKPTSKPVDKPTSKPVEPVATKPDKPVKPADKPANPNKPVEHPAAPGGGPPAGSPNGGHGAAASAEAGAPSGPPPHAQAHEHTPGPPPDAGPPEGPPRGNSGAPRGRP